MVDKYLTKVPLLLSLVRTTIKVHYICCVKHFGKSPMEWDTQSASVRLISISPGGLRTKELLLWFYGQLLGVFLYGLIINVWCYHLDTKGTSGIKDINRHISVLLACLSLVQIGIFLGLLPKVKEVVGGTNGILNYQEELVNGFQYHWNVWEDHQRKLLEALGRGFTMGFITNYSTLCVAFIGIYLRIDPLYFVFKVLMSPPPFSSRYVYLIVHLCCIIIRTGGLLIYMLTAFRNLWFIEAYYLVALQAYLCCIKLLSKVRSPFLLLREYSKLRIYHSQTSPFINATNGMLMFYGHSGGVILYWLSLKGWGKIPDIIALAFSFGGTAITIWLVLLLAAVSGLYISSEKLLEKRFGKHFTFKSYLCRGNFNPVMKRQIAATTPISLTSGTFFLINGNAPGRFFNTILVNLATAVLTIL